MNQLFSAFKYSVRKSREIFVKMFDNVHERTTGGDYSKNIPHLSKRRLKFSNNFSACANVVLGMAVKLQETQ